MLNFILVITIYLAGLFNKLQFYVTVIIIAHSITTLRKYCEWLSFCLFNTTGVYVFRLLSLHESHRRCLLLLEPTGDGFSVPNIARQSRSVQENQLNMK